MERRLYRICADHRITYITIAHRPVLRAYHDLSLAIGDGEQGWKLEQIDRSLTSARALQMAKASVVSAEDEQSMRALQRLRSEPFASRKELKAIPTRGTIKRLLRLCKMAAPEFWIWKGLGILLLIGSQTWVEDWLFGNTSPLALALYRLYSQYHVLYSDDVNLAKKMEWARRS